MESPLLNRLSEVTGTHPDQWNLLVGREIQRREHQLGMHIPPPERPLPNIRHRSELWLKINDVLHEPQINPEKFLDRAIFYIATELEMEQADQMVAKKEFEEATKYCYMALEIAPFLYEAMRCMADCCFSLGKYDPAITAYTATSHVFPDTKDLHYQLGRCYFEKDELNKALEEFEKELSITGEAEDIYIQLGTIHFEKGKQIVDEIIRERIRDKKEIYRRCGDYFVKAEHYYQKALGINPSNTQIREFLDAARRFIKEYDPASSSSETLLERVSYFASELPFKWKQLNANLKKVILSVIGITVLVVLIYANLDRKPAEIPKQEQNFSIGIVIAKIVNIRSGPSQNNPVIAKVRLGDTLMVISESGDWLFIKHKTAEGYVSAKLVKQ